ncbi:ThuA domain-containing protein [Sphaerisporangium sp. NBC_01403]|uniref:ThuA domain-containing protein n=1 Tax=Sphaerisporangium sp. NBC_01403 TaxID=2903599 RepID=UPI00324FF563
MATNLILSGGVAHDFPATSGALAGVLSEVGVESEITEDIAGALADGPDFSLITVNALRCCGDGGWSEQEGGSSFELPPEARAAMLRHLGRGGGVLAVHAAAICFDDWPGWRGLLGASWTWGVSHHPPLGRAEVKVRGGHPIVDGLGDFDLVDEVYSDLDVLPDVRPLASSLGQPLLWARDAGRGRLVYDALGHDVRSYENPAHRALLQRAAQWLLKRDSA